MPNRLSGHFRRLFGKRPTLDTQTSNTQTSNTQILNTENSFVPTPFRYAPLNDASSQIRVIKVLDVLHSRDGEAIGLEISMSTILLAETESYIAVSYCWGNPAPMRQIICNGQSLVVPENTFGTLLTIFHALKRGKTALYAQGEIPWLWIDALCINQHDIQEKNVQVPLMGDIYIKAKGAIGYVGSPREGGDPNNAILALAWQANCPIVSPPEGIPRDQNDPVFQQWLDSAIKEGVVKAPDSMSEDLTDLWSNEWFMRCWMTQEMVLAKDVVCLYGHGTKSCTFPLDTLTLLVERSQSSEHHQVEIHKIGKSFNSLLLEKAVQVGHWKKLRLDWQKGSFMDLVELLRLTRLTRATDPRDKVYSLLGLMKPEDRSAIRVDYSEANTLAEVFLDVARYTMPTSYGQNMLANAGISRSLPDLPTWVPDWTTSYRTALPLGAYNACANLYKPMTVLPDGRRIRALGLKIERVAQIGIPVSYPDATIKFDNGEKGGDNMTRELLLVAAIMCGGARQTFPAYPLLHEDWEDVIWRTCTMNKNWKGRHNLPEDRHEFEDCLIALGFGTDMFAAVDPTREASSAADPGADLTEDDRRRLSRPFGIIATEYQKGRVLALLRGGFFGSLPSETQVGDLVVILFGGWVPFVLRPVENGEFQLVGSCYVHGIMDGKWMQGALAMGAESTDPDWFDKTFTEFTIR